MFRSLFFISALIATPATAQGLPSFDFMTLTTSETYSGEMNIAGKKCKLKGSGEEVCSRFAGAMVGTVAVLNLDTRFNNGHFFAASGWTSIQNAGDLKRAFIAKYGPPDSVEHTPWQNQLGTNFDNEVTTWVFDDGTLVLRARGTRRDMTEFSFVSNDNIPERYKIKDQPVNF